jgi:DNA-binding XRE family transcriptional regulator
MTSRPHRHAPGAPQSPNAGDIGRAKHLRLELSAVLRRSRRRVPQLTQQQLALFMDVERTAVKRWEHPRMAGAPNLLHVALAPLDYARQPIEWVAAVHELEVLALSKVTHADDHTARFCAVARACSNLVRALAMSVQADPSIEQLELWHRESTACVEAAREVKAYAVTSIRRLRR